MKEVSLSAGENSILKISVEGIKPGRFYTCWYDNYFCNANYACRYDWYFCNANYESAEDGDASIKFLHQKGPVLKFFCPCRDHICWIPTKDFYREFEAPFTGRCYSFDEKVMNDVNNFFQ